MSSDKQDSPPSNSPIVAEPEAESISKDIGSVKFLDKQESPQSASPIGTEIESTPKDIGLTTIPHDAPPKKVDSQMSTMPTIAGIPTGFFQSNADLRSWGKQRLTDPAVQPINETDNRGLIPNYNDSCYTYFKSLQEPFDKRPKFVGLGDTISGSKIHPDVHFSSAHTIPVAIPPHAGKVGVPSYKIEDISSYKMEYMPYVNALMNPTDSNGMYVTYNYLTGYPYGVPAVEENEAMDETSARPTMCSFFC